MPRRREFNGRSAPELSSKLWLPPAALHRQASPLPLLHSAVGDPSGQVRGRRPERPSAFPPKIRNQPEPPPRASVRRETHTDSHARSPAGNRDRSRGSGGSNRGQGRAWASPGIRSTGGCCASPCADAQVPGEKHRTRVSGSTNYTQVEAGREGRAMSVALWTQFRTQPSAQRERDSSE